MYIFLCLQLSRHRARARTVKRDAQWTWRNVRDLPDTQSVYGTWQHRGRRRCREMLSGSCSSPVGKIDAPGRSGCACSTTYPMVLRGSESESERERGVRKIWGIPLQIGNCAVPQEWWVHELEPNCLLRTFAMTSEPSRWSRRGSRVELFWRQWLLTETAANWS